MVYEQFFRLRLFPSDALNIVYLRTFIALFYLRLSLYWWRYHNLVITHYIHLIAGCITTRRSCRLFSLFKDNFAMEGTSKRLYCCVLYRFRMFIPSTRTVVLQG